MASLFHHSRSRRAGWLTLAAFVALALLYFWRLDGNLINDDEGSYLYAAWRISLGELPYRDFLTPQLPAFLMPGGWLMRALGPEVWPLRAASALFSLGAALLTYFTARRLFGAGVALIAGVGFALHPLTFYYGRFFRAEAPMLFFAALGTYGFVRAVFPDSKAAMEPARSSLPGLRDEPEPEPTDRRWLLAAGVAFGLAILSKLFGFLPMAGCGLWLVVDGLRRRRFVPMLVDGALLSVAAAVTAGLPLLWFRSISSRLEEAVLGHHLMQGADKTIWQDIGNTLELYFQFVDDAQGGILLFLGIGAAAAAWRRADRRVLLYGCQLVSLLGFFLLTRDLFLRHLMYLLPSLSTLLGVALVPLIAAASPSERHAREGASAAGRHELLRMGRALALALLVGLPLPWLYSNVLASLETESATRRLADLISLVTEPDDLVFGDYSELNFYARRPTSYEGASMSAGAAESGQLAWSVVGARFEEERPRLLVNLSESDHDVGHLVHMPDYDAYQAWIAEYYVKLGAFERDWQRFEVYELADRPVPRLAVHQDGPTLLAARPAVDAAPAGSAVEVISAWQNAPPEEPGTEYVATLRLVDPTGHQWAQADTSLFAYPDRKSPDWAPDELASQRIEVAIPPDAPPGPYRLEVGMYRRNGDSVPQLDAAGNPLWRRALAGTIQVRPGSLRDIPEDAEVAQRYEDARFGPIQVLGRGALPEGPVPAGSTLPLDLWLEVAPAGASTRLWAGPAQAWDEFEGTNEEDPGAAGSIVWASPLIAESASDALSSPTVIRRRVHIPLPLTLPAGPTEIQLAAGPVEDDAPASEALTIARIEVAGAEASDATAPQPPDLGPFSLLALADDLISIDLVEFPSEAEAGDRLEVELGWRALRATDQAWSFSLQLLDAGSSPVAQHDGAAGSWQRPSTEWLAGERMRQSVVLALPEDLPAGSYRLILAFYHPETGYRARMEGPAAAGDLVQLGSVSISKP